MLLDITKRIYTVLDVPVYTDTITKNFSPPAVTIEKKKKNIRPALHKKLSLTETFLVSYFFMEENQEAFKEIEYKLFYALQIIPTKTQSLFAHEFELTYDKKAIHALVSYTYEAFEKPQETSWMKQLTTKMKG